MSRYLLVRQVTNLSPREDQILKLMLSGKQLKEISNELQIHERTVKYHLATIYKFYNVKNKSELFLKLYNDLKNE